MSCACRTSGSTTHTAHLSEQWGFNPEEIIVLTDDHKEPKRLPTKANMLRAMEWLVKDAQATDSLFFHCE